MTQHGLTRRDFLKTTTIGAAGLALTGCAGIMSRSKGPRPNILVVVADDLTYTDAGCYGNHEMQTPNIDSLAREGMRFTHCFTATAMCAPTRQQMYTGLFPVKNGAYPNHSLVYPGIRSIAYYLQELGYRVGLSGKQHFGPAESFPFELLSEERNPDFDRIEEFINRDSNLPYFLLVTSNQPHTPWDKGDASVYDPARLALPPYLVDTPETRQGLAKYYGEITYLDGQVGRCLELVRESGTEENTLFMFTSEQGSCFTHCKWTCYDTGLRTMLIARWPGRIPTGSVSDAMVQYVDFAPTWIEAAQGQSVPGLDGRSFLSVLLGKAAEQRETVFGIHTTRGIIAGSECYPIRSIRTRSHKYILNLNHETEFSNTVIKRNAGGFWNSWVEKARTDPQAAKLVEMYVRRPHEELYDLEQDPYELNNLTGYPRYRSLKDSLRQQLETWMEQQGDKGIETEMLAKSRQRSPS